MVGLQLGKTADRTNSTEVTLNPYVLAEMCNALLKGTGIGKEDMRETFRDVPGPLWQIYLSAA